MHVPLIALGGTSPGVVSANKLMDNPELFIKNYTLPKKIKIDWVGGHLLEPDSEVQRE